MKTIPSLFAAGGLAFLTACGEKDVAAEAKAAVEQVKVDPAVAIANSIAASMEEIPNLMLSIKDEESLAAAGEKLKNMSQGFEKHVESLSELPVPSNEVRLEIKSMMDEKEAAFT